MLVTVKILQPVSQFIYLGCDISFKFDTEIWEVNTFQIIYGITERILGRKTIKKPKLNFIKSWLCLPYKLFRIMDTKNKEIKDHIYSDLLL